MLNFTLPPFAVTSKKQLLCNYSVPFGLNNLKKSLTQQSFITLSKHIILSYV